MKLRLFNNPSKIERIGLLQRIDLFIAIQVRWVVFPVSEPGRHIQIPVIIYIAPSYGACPHIDYAGPRRCQWLSHCIYGRPDHDDA